MRRRASRPSEKGIEMKTAVRFCAIALALAGCGPTPVERTEWLQMGTVAAVQTRGPLAPELVAAVRASLSSVESLLNAHDSASELSRLAASTDAEILARCTPSVRPCYESAFALARETDGAFSPRWRGPGTLDLGAIAKGFALDEAARRLAPEVPTLLDLGGNLKACKGDWTVGVKDGESFILREGEACATSALYYRGDHIRDARTGESVSNALHSVTVIHPTSAMLADALSTALFILGPEKGTAFLLRHHPEARAIWTECYTGAEMVSEHIEFDDSR